MNNHQNNTFLINDICKELEQGSLIEIWLDYVYVFNYRFESDRHIINVEKYSAPFMECSVNDCLGSVLNITGDNFLTIVNILFKEPVFDGLTFEGFINRIDKKEIFILNDNYQDIFQTIENKNQSLNLDKYKTIFRFSHNAYFGNNVELRGLYKENKYYIYTKGYLRNPNWYFEIPKKEMRKLVNLTEKFIRNSRSFKQSSTSYLVLDGLVWSVMLNYKIIKFELSGYHDTPKGFNGFYDEIIDYFNKLAKSYIYHYDISLYQMI